MIQDKILKTISNEIKDPLTGIDIEFEYALVQEKKSDLSRVKRELILKIYPDYIKWKNAK